MLHFREGSSTGEKTSVSISTTALLFVCFNSTQEIVSKQISTKKEYDTSQQEVANLADLLQHLQAEPTTGAQ